MSPGDALVSTISISDSEKSAVRAWLSPGSGTESICRTAGVLTCVAAPVPTDAFRPSYCDRGQKIYYADSIRWNLLPNLQRVASMNAATLSEWSRHFMNSPWLDVCFFGFDAPVDYMTHYSAETARATGIATELLICNFTQAQKDSLMKGLVQYGDRFVGYRARMQRVTRLAGARRARLGPQVAHDFFRYHAGRYCDGSADQHIPHFKNRRRHADLMGFLLGNRRFQLRVYWTSGNMERAAGEYIARLGPLRRARLRHNGIAANRAIPLPLAKATAAAAPAMHG